LDFSVPADKNKNIQSYLTSTHDEKHGRIEDRSYALVLYGVFLFLSQMEEFSILAV
jgi:hypothetical protein